MSDAVILAEISSGQLVHANIAATDILEVGKSEICSLNLFSLFHDCFRSHHQSLEMAMIKNHGRVSNMRAEIAGYHGKKTPVLLTVDLVYDENRHEMFLVTIKDNTEAEQLTYSNALTGVYNRRYFDFRSQEEYSRLVRGQPEFLSMLFLDIDYFKQFNSDYGHRFGDTVLRAVAQVMKDSARLSDVVCRYGGEEFVIILTGTNANGALVFADRLRRRIASLRVLNQGTDTKHGVTVTIGVSTQRTGHVGTAEQLTGEANDAMLEAKRRGRNQVLSFDNM
jgi:diguanylate cyclase (GGDEF)-like protein/PAS domain S-box-containing protein